MSKVEWAVFAGIVGAVVVGIAVEPNHEDMEMEGRDQSAMVMEATATSRTVALAVSGMT